MSNPKLTATCTIPFSERDTRAGINASCTCTPCREGFSNFCENGPETITHLHEFGAPTELENYHLELVLQTLLGDEKWPCPCLIGERYDELLLTYGYSFKEDIADEIREQFIKYYNDCTGLEACEEDECEYPDGLSPEDCMGDFDHGQYMIDQQQAYWDGINEERFSSKI